MLTTVKMFRTKPDAKLPVRKTPQSAGADVFACIEDLGGVVIEPGETKLIPLGIKTEFAPGHVALLFARSGLANEKGLAPANKVGVIDADYRGEWMIALHNHSKKTQIIEDGERIGQVLFQEVEIPLFEEVETEEELSKTERGEGGFGSTGAK